MIRLMTADDFWENAKPSRQTEKPHWMTFDDQWVDEVRRGSSLRCIPLVPDLL